ncbi:hypothetical protein LTR86_005083 [Recurvomyces mirabilis]|nr:hypothetical protein LTR86_005083 [Recurvomyces mirabilis]
MEYQDSNKRFKAANGAPVPIKSPAANLPAYQPPAPVSVGGRASSSGSTANLSASVDRSSNGAKPGLRLTVKAPPSKLRQATSSSQQAPIPPNPYADGLSESDATAAPATRTARSTRNPKAVIEPESEDNDDDAEGEEDDMEMEDDIDQELLANEDDDEDEDVDAEGDEDEEMEGHPPPPVIKQTMAQNGRPNVTVTAPSEGPLKSVEAKEMDDDEDEELSELEEGDVNELEGDGDEDDEDDSGDSDNDSRSATPDLTKLTRRQRGRYEETDASLMALSNEALKKKHLTAEEHAMRRAEMARRRKNLSEKRNEEEKMDTINKLLSKPAPKRRTRAEIIAAQHAEAMGTPGAENGEYERPDPLFTRYVQDRSGARLGVPEEWLEVPVGQIFGRLGGGKMVEEVA